MVTPNGTLTLALESAPQQTCTTGLHVDSREDTRAAGNLTAARLHIFGGRVCCYIVLGTRLHRERAVPRHLQPRRRYRDHDAGVRVCRLLRTYARAGLGAPAAWRLAHHRAMGYSGN